MVETDVMSKLNTHFLGFYPNVVKALIKRFDIPATLSIIPAFFDYDYDGDLDIFITGASAYRGNFFMAFTNNGNSTFTDSTESLLDEHYFFHGTRGVWNMNSGQGDPQFYEIFIIDFIIAASPNFDALITLGI